MASFYYKLAVQMSDCQKGGENMAITKWEPFRFPSFFEEFEPTQRGLKIHETDKDLIAEAVVAGVSADDVEVHIEDGVLTIKAEVNEENRAYQYYYTAALSGGQWNKAEADIENGIVTITIPKQEAARPQKITVRQKKDR